MPSVRKIKLEKSVGELLVEGFQELADTLKKGEPLEEKFVMNGMFRIEDERLGELNGVFVQHPGGCGLSKESAQEELESIKNFVWTLYANGKIKLPDGSIPNKSLIGGTTHVVEMIEGNQVLRRTSFN